MSAYLGGGSSGWAGGEVGPLEALSSEDESLLHTLVKTRRVPNAVKLCPSVGLLSLSWVVKKWRSCLRLPESGCSWNNIAAESDQGPKQRSRARTRSEG